MTTTTVIKNAEWVIGWDAEAKKHVYVRNADVTFTGNTISFVGRSYQGPRDLEIDGSGLMVMPGLVNIHAHPSEDTHPMGLYEGGFDAGEEGEIAFMERLRDPRRRAEGGLDLRPLGAEVGYAEMLLSGVTTLVDISESSSYPGWVELMERSGLRAYVSPTFPSFASEESVEAQLARSLAIIDRAMASKTGRLSGVVVPFDVLSVPDDLLRRSLVEARQRGIPLKIHAAEAMFEFKEVARKRGITPIQVLDQLGLLGPGTILAHAIFFDHHPALKNAPPYNDIGIVARSGASVSHAPYGFALSCVAMDGFSRYREAGINVGLGTDTFGHNMLEEMRLAMLLSRIVSGRVEGATAADVFHAATVGGAQALQRDDIGYLARNAKADLVVVDLDQPAMQPVNDPLRSLIFKAGERAIRDVYVDGVKVVENGKVLTLDCPSACSKLDQAIRPKRTEAAELAEESLPAGSSVFAIPVRRGLTVGVSHVVDRREVLHGRIEDVPYEHWTPNYDPRLWERPAVPFGLCSTLDVSVSKMEPGCELDYTTKRTSTFDWYVQGLSGVGVVEIGGQRLDVLPGTVVLLPVGTRYVIANRSSSDWVWYSIHPHLPHTYKVIDEESRKEEFDKMTERAKKLKPGKLVYAQIKEASFDTSPGNEGLAEHQLVLSKDFDVSLRRLRGRTRLPDCRSLSYDLYLHGVAGTGVLEVNGRKMELGPDMFAFLPEGIGYSLVNSTTSDWEFIWMHKPEA